MSTPESPLLCVGIPTRDGQAMIQTVLSLIQVGRQLDRPTAFFLSEASNIPRGRNLIVDQLRYRFPRQSTVRVLWIDADIWILPSVVKPIAEAIRWAEAHDTNITANYLMANGESVLLRERTADTKHYTHDEWEHLPDYAPIGMTGFGFLYLDHPLDYTFYADRIGEDIHFWWDHSTIELYLAKQIALGHKKTVMLAEPIQDPSASADESPTEGKAPVATIDPSSLAVSLSGGSSH
jgi:hypothetical protein